MCKLLRKSPQQLPVARAGGNSIPEAGSVSLDYPYLLWDRHGAGVRPRDVSRQPLPKVWVPQSNMRP